MSPERKIEAHIVKLAKRHGWFCRKVRWIGRNGAPDRLLIRPDSRVFWVEVKAPRKKPTKLQLREHREMDSYGHCPVVIDSLESAEALFA